ncbi:MAG: rRNA maturation RNase YbeY [Solirubrobacteraceae bacterium]
MLDVEVIGLGLARDAVAPGELEVLCAVALASGGIEEGHLAVEFVEAERMREVNRSHRGIDAPTDVLSFPVDGVDGAPGPHELGDVLICPAHTADEREAVLHGALHLAGMDHESDDGEMLALQREILGWR